MTGFQGRTYSILYSLCSADDYTVIRDEDFLNDDFVSDTDDDTRIGNCWVKLAHVDQLLTISIVGVGRTGVFGEWLDSKQIKVPRLAKGA